MTSDNLALYAGLLLSRLFTYVPGLNAKFDALEPTYKRLIMLASLLVVSGAVYGLSCGKLYDLVTCDKAGFLKLVELFVQALVANQAAYLITPKRSTAMTAPDLIK